MPECGGDAQNTKGMTLRPPGKKRHAEWRNKVNAFGNVKIRSGISHWISDAPRKVQKQEGPAF